MVKLKDVHPGEFFTFKGRKYQRVAVMDEDGPDVSTYVDHLLCVRTFDGNLRSFSGEAGVSRL